MKYNFVILVVKPMGYEKMAEIVKQHGLLPKTPVLKKKDGTYYYFFRQTNEPARNVLIDENVELLADGNYEGVLPEEFLKQVQDSLG